MNERYFSRLTQKEITLLKNVANEMTKSYENYCYLILHLYPSFKNKKERTFLERRQKNQKAYAP
jgi:hypothetical protein